jgi:hypothetical protein
MIYLIHGQNQVDSRRYLVRLKSNYDNIETISGKRLSVFELKKILQQISHHLFSTKTAIVIEQFVGDWQVFPEKTPQGVDIILWTDKKISVGKTRVKSFLFDRVKRPTAFKLADAVLFRREREALTIASQLLSFKEPPEKIIGALSRGLYLVYIAKSNSLLGTRLPDFAKEKILDQAKLWRKTTLKRALLYLLKSDLAIKEGARSQQVFATFVSRAVSL